MEQLLPEALKMLELKVGKSTVQSWFNSVEVQGKVNNQCTLMFPSAFVKSWIHSNYAQEVCEIIKSVYGVSQVLFEVASATTKPVEISDYSMRVDTKMSFSTFVIGESNISAYTASNAFGKESISNSLYIYGEPGHGKTHLLQAVANRFLHQGKRVCYLSAEQYMLLFIESIRDKQMIKFKNDMRDLDLLLIDDFQFIQGKDSTQEEFFYNMNYLLSQNKHIMVAADRIPGDLKIDPRIKARISGGLALGVESPSTDLKVKILTNKAKQYKNITQDVIEMIATDIKGSIRELEGALLRIGAQIEFFGDTVDVPSAKLILRDILCDSKPYIITNKDIIRVIEKFYKCDLNCNSRERKVIKARQIGMYLCRKIKNISLPVIASIFGVKDHTNVIYSIKQVELKIKTDPDFADEVQILRKKVELGE
jgi:chromosomal replication initiator protein